MKKHLPRLVPLVGVCAMLTLALGGVAHALPVPVPELDPGTASSGIAVLVGSGLLLIERYRRRRRGQNQNAARSPASLIAEVGESHADQRVTRKASD